MEKLIPRYAFRLRVVQGWARLSGPETPAPGGPKFGNSAQPPEISVRGGPKLNAGKVKVPAQGLAIEFRLPGDGRDRQPLSLRIMDQDDLSDHLRLPLVLRGSR